MNSIRTAALGCLALAVMHCSGQHSPTSEPTNDGNGNESPGGGSGSGGSDLGSGASSGGGNSSGSGSGSGSSSGSTSSGTSGGSNDAGTGVTIAPDGAVTGPADVAGCGTAKFYKVPDDTGAAGPWPVGVKTIQLAITGGTIPVEVWYPASLGSDTGKTAVSYDLLSWLPAGQASKVPASENKLQDCNCFRDLPLDTTHGPYPAVIFIHGTGSFRTASLTQMTTWASRGFIAVAADHPGLFLTDFISGLSGGACTGTGITQNLGRDVDAEIAALTNKTGDFAFLGTSIDMTRIGMSGHSQGASNAATFASKPNVQVDMPLADLSGTLVPTTSSLKSVLIVAGMSDQVVTYSNDMSAYSGSPSPKRLVGITGGDHLDVTDLCWEKNSSGETGIQVAQKYMICGTGTTLLANLAKCGTLNPPNLGSEITNYVTTAALEETLHCADRSAAFSALKSKYPQVGDFEHTP